MATKRLLKIANGLVREFADTDTIPGSSTPARSVISPSQITADQDNYNPTGWADADLVRLDFDTGGRAITGFSAWTNGRQKRVVNISGNFAYIPPEHTDSTAANRVVGTLDYILEPYGDMVLECDSTSSRIRVVSNSFNVRSPFFRGIYHSVCPGATLGSDWGAVGFGINGGNNGVVNPTSTLPGTWEINTSTSATGASSLYLPKGANNPVRYGSAHLVSVAWVYFTTLSDGTQTYTFTHGLCPGNSGTSLTQSDAVFIRYTHGTNSGKFQGVCVGSGGTEATVDLGITVAVNTGYVLAVCFDKARTEARFYINGALAGIVTSQIPAATSTGDRTLIIKSAGTTIRSANVAYKTFFALY